MHSVNSPEPPDTPSTLRRVVGRGIRPTAYAIAVLSAAVAALIFWGPDPKITRISAESVRVALACILAVAAVFMLIRAFLPTDRWVLPSAVLFALVGFGHATALGDLVRGPVSGIFSMIAGLLCFIATIAIIVVVSESRPSSTGSHLR